MIHKICFIEKKGKTMESRNQNQNRTALNNVPYIWSPKKVYSWKEPIHLPGCQHSLGTPETGYVIQNQYTGSEYVAVPVECLPKNGTIDGTTHVKYGRRYFRQTWWTELLATKSYNNWVNKAVFRSVHKYKIFYISRYMAAKDNTGKVVFTKGLMPCTIKEMYEMRMRPEHFLKEVDKMPKEVYSCLPPGEAYDTLCEAIIHLKAQTYKEIVRDSTNLGNYWKSPNSPHKLMPNGSKENGYVFNINGLAGNFGELTNERSGNFYVWRGNNFGWGGGIIADRFTTLYEPGDYVDQRKEVACRAVVCLKA